ncbi:MAG: hypothetical protein Q8P67_26395, partial [archaeon]|nr:hypothetical protein [archaeon]
AGHVLIRSVTSSGLRLRYPEWKDSAVTCAPVFRGNAVASLKNLWTRASLSLKTLCRSSSPISRAEISSENGRQVFSEREGANQQPSTKVREKPMDV